MSDRYDVSNVFTILFVCIDTKIVLFKAIVHRNDHVLYREEEVKRSEEDVKRM